MLHYKLDKQEQYTRRETIKVVGLPETSNEDVQENVLKVFTAAGCEVRPDDISTVHRTGLKNKTGRQSNNGNFSSTNISSSSRPVLVKFTTRKTKAYVMAQRKQLKKTAKYQKVFLNDDLNPLRSRMLHVAKRNSNVDRVSSTSDEKIRCVLKKTPGQSTADSKVIFLDTPDDLFHLGVDSLDFPSLGLQQFVL
ncbi:hypothetical protein ACOMHN_033436 [Nucella lapillus]